MARIALLTPAAHNPYVRIWGPAFDRLTAALSGAGLEVVSMEWPKAAEAEVDAVLPLLAWGYHQDAADWLAMLGELEAKGVKAINPAAVLRWNTTKTYLADLEAAGVPVVPTVFAERADDAVVARARAELGAETLVVKPQVSGGSHETVKLAAGEALVGGPSGAAMIQPFLPSVLGRGRDFAAVLRRRLQSRHRQGGEGWRLPRPAAVRLDHRPDYPAGRRPRGREQGAGRRAWRADLLPHRPDPPSGRDAAADGAGGDRTRPVPGACAGAGAVFAAAVLRALGIR